MNTATYIRTMDDFQGYAALYSMNPPLDGSEFVIVSAINNSFGFETYIFASDCDGEILNYCELSGSIRGTNDHSEALKNAGYSIKSN